MLGAGRSAAVQHAAAHLHLTLSEAEEENILQCKGDYIKHIYFTSAAIFNTTKGIVDDFSIALSCTHL